VTSRSGSGTSPDGGARHRWTAGEGAGGRLDSYVAAQLGLSRNRVVALLEAGRVLVDGQTTKKSGIVAPGQVVDVVVPPPVALSAEAQDIPLDIVFQDRDLVVVDKQAGLVVHPAPGHPDGTLVNALLYHVGDLSGIGGKLRPGIVHRLDRDTSGLMVVAKTDRAHQGLAAGLKERVVKRTYLVSMWGRLRESTVVVDRPVGRHRGDRMRMAVVEGGRPARTRFRQIESWLAACFCEAALDTGRTHQIRVHAAAIGHPVVGDRLYGANAERGFSGAGRRWARDLARRTGRQFLHAHRLEFEHPASGEAMSFTAPLPSELEDVRRWALDGASHPSG